MDDLKNAPLENLSIDPSERPHLPPMPNATDEHRRQGRKLAAIHRGHLWDLARIGKVLDRIEVGDAPPEALKDIVLAAEMTENYRAFGSLCGHECKMLKFHHDAEEFHMFPELERKGSEAVARLVARLREEHGVVHELLERLERASMALMFEPADDAFAAARATFMQLQEVVRSHFGYEESELEEAIGVYLEHL